MSNPVQGVLTVLGRVMLSLIFLMSAAGNKIPNFAGVSKYMASEGVPMPDFLLGGAIVFLLVGGISIVLGYKARIGATLLLIFLAAATYYFHDFWNVSPEKVQTETIAFMKNTALMGTMLMIIANGSGAWSLDTCGKAAKAGH